MLTDSKTSRHFMWHGYNYEVCRFKILKLRAPLNTKITNFLTLSYTSSHCPTVFYTQRQKNVFFRAEPSRKGHLEISPLDFENTAVGKGSTLKTRVWTTRVNWGSFLSLVFFFFSNGFAVGIAVELSCTCTTWTWTCNIPCLVRCLMKLWYPLYLW